MNQDIKYLVIRFLNDLKKSWLLGIVCIVLAIVFVIVTTFYGAGSNSESDIAQSTMVGVQSVIKLNWNFEKNADNESGGTTFQTKVSNAKESLLFFVTLSESGNFWNDVNGELQAIGYSELSHIEDFVLQATSYNVLEIKVVGYDAEKVQLIEKIIREKVESFVVAFYDVDSVDIISNPVVLEAEIVGEQYILSNKLYDIESDANNLLDEKEQKQLFSFSNIVIVLSSIVLWGVIVLLNTISDKKIYTIKDIEGLDRVCFGELEKNIEANNNIISIISKNLQNTNESAVKLVHLGGKNSEVIDSFAKGVAEKFDGNLAVCDWKNETIDKIQKDEKIILIINSGIINNEELLKCVQAIEIAGATCIGFVLFK